jgi:mannose-6-phosphate isomerase-like protein (cupin superfamily)
LNQKGDKNVMKKVAIKDIKKYGTPPKHYNMNSARLQGKAETGIQKFWVGVSHYLPGGGIEWGGEDSAEDKVYLVLDGEILVKGKNEEFVLGPMDSLYIGPNEGRSVVNTGIKPATLLVIVNTIC